MAPPQYLFPAEAQFGADNLILHAKARKHSVEGFPGPFSIKTVISGEVTWRLDRREVSVDSRSFLVLRAGQLYSLRIDAPAPVETCCVFFRSGFAEQVFDDATTPLEASLDNPARVAPEFPFASYLHPDDNGRLLPYVQTLARRCEGELAPSASEEAFLEVAVKLLSFYREVRLQMSRLPALKAGTREELFRRLLVAREYIHGSLDGRFLWTLLRMRRACRDSIFIARFRALFSARRMNTSRICALRGLTACSRRVLRQGMPASQPDLRAHRHSADYSGRATASCPRN